MEQEKKLTFSENFYKCLNELKEYNLNNPMSNNVILPISIRNNFNAIKLFCNTYKSFDIEYNIFKQRYYLLMKVIYYAYKAIYIGADNDIYHKLPGEVLRLQILKKIMALYKEKNKNISYSEVYIILNSYSNENIVKLFNSFTQ
jgi:hypothetical protein